MVFGNFIGTNAYESTSPGHDSGGSPEDGWRVEGEPRELQHHCVEASCMGEQYRAVANFSIEIEPLSLKLGVRCCLMMFDLWLQQAWTRIMMEQV